MASWSVRRRVVVAVVVLGLAPLGGPTGAGATPSAPAVPRAALVGACHAARLRTTEARHALRVAEHRLTATYTSLRPGAFPSITDPSGVWRTGPAAQWTSGFFPGSLWLAYRRTHLRSWKVEARSWTRRLAGQAADTTTHDVGFQIMSSFGNGYALTRSERYRATIVEAAGSLASRYDPEVGAIRSWGPRHGLRHFKVIIDNLMNLRLLFWASRHGGPRAWKEMATRHALTTARHFVRHDGSVVHLVDFDPRNGRVLAKANPQGYGRHSTWSRGQAWAVAGFTEAYLETGNPRLLAVARRTAGYVIAHLPRDCVPPWDFDAPATPAPPTDTSAAAIAADGLLQLARVHPRSTRAARYAEVASRILSSLATRFLAPRGEATLRGGTSTFGVDPPDIGTSYGDYYFLHAIETWLGRHAPR